jgi:hypothetical protein
MQPVIMGPCTSEVEAGTLYDTGATHGRVSEPGESQRRGLTLAIRGKLLPPGVFVRTLAELGCSGRGTTPR